MPIDMVAEVPLAGLFRTAASGQRDTRPGAGER
jgi:hypothetical protein